MCLIVIAIDQHPDFPLVVAANRDEFYQRPTQPMHWWPDRNLLAGKDDRSGGTWLAVTPQGNVAAVTNVRDGLPESSSRSRGDLPLQALNQSQGGLERSISQNASEYGGFNLIIANSQSGWYYSNRDDANRKSQPGRSLHRGVYGLSNHLLQSPWPKLVNLQEKVRQRLQQTDTETLHRKLVDDLADTTPAPDHCLPDTGVGLETERFLSSPFISSEAYGTRATTIVTRDRYGTMTVTEQCWGPSGQRSERQQFQWLIE